MAKSEVAEWYKGQNILLTGATGFMGTIFVEKLLRCCPDLGAIFLLIRPKWGKKPKERLEEYLQSEVFNELKKSERGEAAFKKLILVEGDLTEENCSLSKEAVKRLQEEVTIILHTAADVRFEQPLRDAVNINVMATRNTLDLACSFKKLKVFVHVSTAYCQCQEEVLEEKVYKPLHDPRKIINLVNLLDVDVLKVLAPHLFGQFPNAYSYTKNLSEGLVQEYSDKLPLVIARPSMVVSVYKEPIPGWSNNINGPMGIMVGGSTGMLRVMHGYPEYHTDLIPVDIVNNSILLIAWKEGKQQRKSGLEVYNVTLAEKNFITLERFVEYSRKYIRKYPPSMILWYPDGSVENNAVWFEIILFLKHTIPAFFIDLVVPLLGHKPFMKKIQKKIRLGIDLLSYYTTRQWMFKNEKFGSIYKVLNDTDKSTFYTDWLELDWEYYMENFSKQLRTHVNNDTPDTLPRARKLFQWLKFLHNTVQFIFWIFILLTMYYSIVLTIKE